MKRKIIGITDCAKYLNYEKWILEAGSFVEVVKLSQKTENENDLLKCDGVLLTGGQDVHPSFYNKDEYLKYSDPSDIDGQRDFFEKKVLELTIKNNLPLLGICRGLQITNAFLGGTLIPDLPSFGKFNHSRFTETDDRYHSIIVDRNSYLYSLVSDNKTASISSYSINSAHHQSADMIAPGLVASAISPDGVVECLERKTQSSSFFLLVQWHPERMLDKNDNPFSYKIREAFLGS